MNKILTLTVSTLFLFMVSAASAIPVKNIYGKIGFSGESTITANSTQTALSYIDFTALKANFATNDFASLNGKKINNINSLDLEGALPSYLWKKNGFTFSLSEITSNVVMTLPNSPYKFAAVAGTGTISHNNFMDTIVSWAYTTQYTGNGTAKVTFSADVPSPTGAAFLGLGLLGFAFVRRNKQA